MTSRIPLGRFLLPLLLLVILIGWVFPTGVPEASMTREGYSIRQDRAVDPSPGVEDDGDAPPDTTFNAGTADGDPDDLEHMDGDGNSTLKRFILILVRALRL